MADGWLAGWLVRGRWGQTPGARPPIGWIWSRPVKAVCAVPFIEAGHQTSRVARTDTTFC